MGEDAEAEASERIGELSTQLQQRSLELQRQIMGNRQRLQENVIEAQRRMAADFDALARGFRGRLEHGAAECEELIQDERAVVENIKQESLRWKSRVSQLDAAYRYDQ